MGKQDPVGAESVHGEWEEEQVGESGNVEWRRYSHTVSRVDYWLAVAQDSVAKLMVTSGPRPGHYILEEICNGGDEARRWRFDVSAHNKGDNLEVASFGYIVESGAQAGTRVTGVDIPETIKTIFNQMGIDIAT